MARKKQADSSVEIYTIKITLMGARPPIWRRVAVRGNMTLARLHDVIQSVMGWEECHLHEFRTKRARYGPPYPDTGWDMDMETLDERKVKLCDVLSRPKEQMEYEYDFGDGWLHRLRVEKVGPPDPGVRYPVCLAGKLACPPEDCGGVWGYAHLLEALADPDHEQHDELMEWVGGEFDPAAFDLEVINKILRRIR